MVGSDPSVMISCGHVSHKFCMEEHIKSKLKWPNIALVCPKCSKKLESNDFINLTKDVVLLKRIMDHVGQ